VGLLVGDHEVLMAHHFRLALTLLAWMLVGSSFAEAHYNMLLPERASAKKDAPVTFIYQWGHPFEQQLFDAPAPTRLAVFAPDGKEGDLTKALEKVKSVTADGKQVTAYRLRFKPDQRGDYTFVLYTPPIWMEEDKEFVQDIVQVVLHVQAQKGWDVDTGQRFKLLPLTRPYGLQPGMVFQAQVVAPTPGGLGHPLGVKPLAGSLVEVERYNARPPRPLPPDEQITRTVRTDPNGIVTCTLTDPGWWCITAQRSGSEQERNGKRYRVRHRATLWVFVNAHPATGAAK
jgi:cobalt/nickel transport protein